MAYYNEISILKEIYDFSNCDVALLTTFNFDISFFDRSILPALSKSKARTCLFVDSNQFQESMKEKYNSYNIGRHYFVKPFKLSKSFHPKVILLLGKKESKLIVSSANLTYSSHYSNNELFQSYSYSENDEQYINLFIQAFDFFKKLSSNENDIFVDDLMNYVSTNYKFLLSDANENTTKMLTSYSESILNQVSKNIKEEIKEIRVAVPFYDKDLYALSCFKNKFPNAKITLYLQDSQTTFPKDKYSETIIDKTIVFGSVLNNGHEQKQFYHGKVFNFVSDTQEYILFGSANFSASALVKSYKDGGNIEASIFDQGSPGCFDELFNCFKIKDNNIANLETRPQEERANDVQDVATFLHGEINNNVVKVTIKTNGIIPETIAVNGIEIDDKTIKQIDSNCYLICFRNCLECNIFDLTITNIDPQIKVRCFACNIDYLNLYINSSVNNPFKKLNTDEDIEQYDKCFFLKQFEEITNDIRFGIQQEQEKHNSFSTQEVNDDTSYEENEEDEQLDSSLYETPDYVITLGSHEVYSKATAYLSYFSNKTSMLLNKKGGFKTRQAADDVDKEDIDEPKEKTRAKTSYINSILKYFSSYADKSNTKLAGLNFDFYFKLYELFSDTFITDIYLNKTKKVDMTKLVDAKIKFINNRLIPSLDFVAQESEQFGYLKKEIALLCLELYPDPPTDIHVFIETMMKLDIRFNNTFIDEIESLMYEVGSTLEIKNTAQIVDYFKKFIVNSPKTEELINIINNHFGFLSSNTSIFFDEETSCLKIMISEFVKKNETAVLALKASLRDNIINNINRYYSDKKSDYISFEICISNYLKNASQVKYEWNENKYNKYMQTIDYLTGLHYSSEPKFV